MMGKGLIGAAVVLYGVILGCVMWPGGVSGGKNFTIDAPQAAERRVSHEILPLRGAGMQLQRVDWADQYKKSIDEIADLGGDTVSLVVDTRQENGSSSRIYLDMRMTPSPEMLKDVIGHAKSRGLRVILMPIVLLDNPRGTEWRGTISPHPDAGGWDEWWLSYREMMKHFAWIAEGSGVDVLSVGSELVSTESQVEEWTKTIDAVRSTYHGLLTYSSNWDHYTSVTFWNQLDLIGMNSYWKLGENQDVTVEEIQSNWKEIQSDLLAFQRKTDKPLLFLEVGWCSLANAAHEPWDYTKLSEPVDLELQRKLYEGFFRSWHGNPSLGGFIVWEWTPGDGEDEDRGYTPEKKPAEKVLREWLEKPAWDVQ